MAPMVMGTMIGSGIFLVSADMARLINSPGWLLAAWGLTAVLTVFAALGDRVEQPEQRRLPRRVLQDPLGAPLIPNWNRVTSAIPGITEMLKKAVDEDNR